MNDAACAQSPNEDPNTAFIIWRATAQKKMAHCQEGRRPRGKGQRPDFAKIARIYSVPYAGVPIRSHGDFWRMEGVEFAGCPAASQWVADRGAVLAAHA
jgi:hypothetical protein